MSKANKLLGLIEAEDHHLGKLLKATGKYGGHDPKFNPMTDKSHPEFLKFLKDKTGDKDIVSVATHRGTEEFGNKFSRLTVRLKSGEEKTLAAYKWKSNTRMVDDYPNLSPNDHKEIAVELEKQKETT